jgi:hypothetical protein
MDRLEKISKEPQSSMSMRSYINSPSLQKVFDEIPSPFKEAEHEFAVIRLSPDLDLEINRMVETVDSLDSSDFNAVEYFSKLFPDDRFLIYLI